jgi:hypothetical protein
MVQTITVIILICCPFKIKMLRAMEVEKLLKQKDSQACRTLQECNLNKKKSRKPQVREIRNSQQRNESN